MSRTTRIILLSVFALSLALGAVWTITRPPTPVEASKPAIGLSNQSETWNLGVTVEGAPVYADILDRLAGESAAFRSNRDVNEMTFIFPASSVTRLVQTASVNLLSRSGSYPGTADLSLVVYSFDGSQARTVSAGSVDLQTFAVGDWTSLSLTANARDLLLAPDEFLAFHLTWSDGPAGDLDLRPVFEVSVR